jgi:hypothetical protein
VPTTCTRGKKSLSREDEIQDIIARGPADSYILRNTRDTSRQGKLLRILLKILSYHHDNGNVLSQTSMDKSPFITNLSDEI